jgi:hypothetical protein
MIETSEILDPGTLKLAFFIVFIILTIRAFQLKITGNKLFPLLFIVPRGLITILLFMSITTANKIPFITENLTLQIIVISSAVMILGTATVKKS